MNNSISKSVSVESSFLKWILLAVLSVIWGSSFILIKKGLLGFGFIEAATIRLMSAGILFLFLAIKYFKLIPKDKLIYTFYAALFGMFIPAYLFCLAQEKVASGVAGLLNALTPAFAFVFSILIFKSIYKFSQFAGLLIGLISAMLLAFERSENGIIFNSYALLIMLATLSYGFNINLVKNKLQDVPSLPLSYISVSIAGLMAFLFFCLPRLSHYSFNNTNATPLISLIILGVCGTAIAQVIYYKLIQMTTPLFSSSVTFLIPIVALFWGILDGESLHMVHLFCIMGILVGVYLIRKS
ncbi:MAG: DMT family transporter [Saprospiraceae bacterium]